MDDLRDRLTRLLEGHYRRSGWNVRRSRDGTLLATGPSGVTWIGAAILADDLASDDFEERIVGLSGRRMPDGGELCPLDLLPAEECERDLRDVLDRLGLSGEPHVSVYSRAA